MSILPIYRSFLWRLGRRLYMSARSDATLTPDKNGEYWLQDKILNSFSDSHYRYVFFDIGANISEWTNSILDISTKQNKNCSVHLFEPASETYNYLKLAHANSSRVKLNNIALSNRSEDTQIYIHESMSAINSLYQNGYKSVEKVQALKLDDYVKFEKINHIDFIKSDTEGHDFKVILGAEDSLKNGVIDIWQFEYNSKWINARNYLKDVFDFVEDMDYFVGKISKNGVEVFDKWHPELERFFESNYLLIKKNNKLSKNLYKNVIFNQYNVLISKE
jgi:FkbM family methyltransferase